MKLNDRSKWLSGDYDPVPAAVAAFILVQLLCSYGGVGVSPDSVVYISTAQNIHDHHAINDFTNMPVMDFPVLYPCFLAGIMYLTGLKVLSFGPVLDGLLFAAVILLCGFIMRQNEKLSRGYRAFLLVILVLSSCLLEVYSMIWSETLFLLLSVVFVIVAHGYFRTRRVRFLLGMALVAALSCITRYAGVSLVALGGLLLLCDGGLRWGGKKMGHIGVYGLVSVSLLALNLYRNLKLTTTLTGFREPGETPFRTNLHDFGSVLCDWMPFFDEHYGAAGVIAVVFILLIAGIFLYRLVRGRDLFSWDNLALSYFIVYTAFILATATISRFQRLDSRLLSPLFIPWVWGGSSWIPRVLRRCPPRWKRWAIGASLIAGVCFIYGEVHDFRDNWQGIHYAGIPGYTENSWRQSATMAYIRGHTDSLIKAGHMYSDAFEGLWFLADVHADLIPHKDNPDDIRYMMRETHFTVVWFDDAVNYDLIDIPYFKRQKELVEELHFKDGAIYFFRTRAAEPGH